MCWITLGGDQVENLEFRTLGNTGCFFLLPSSFTAQDWGLTEEEWYDAHIYVFWHAVCLHRSQQFHDGDDLQAQHRDDVVALKLDKSGSLSVNSISAKATATRRLRGQGTVSARKINKGLTVKKRKKKKIRGTLLSKTTSKALFTRLLVNKGSLFLNFFFPWRVPWIFCSSV